MTDRSCSEEGCTNDGPYSRGWCNRHYMSWWRHGDPQAVERNAVSLEDRFWGKANKAGPIPQHAPELGVCWEWVAGKTGQGYGGFWYEGSTQGAHIVSLKMAGEEIPDGEFVLHKCDNPACVRPSHLFVGDQAANIADMVSKGRHRSQGKTHCPRGHAYTEANTYVNPTTGGRVCRDCAPLRPSAIKQAVHAEAKRQLRRYRRMFK